MRVRRGSISGSNNKHQGDHGPTVYYSLLKNTLKKTKLLNVCFASVFICACAHTHELQMDQ